MQHVTIESLVIPMRQHLLSGMSDFPYQAEIDRIDFFIDRFDFWVEEPFTNDEIRRLCKANNSQKIYGDNADKPRVEIVNTPPLDQQWKQRVKMMQPTLEAIALLFRMRPRIWMNYLEAAFDIIFKTAEAVEQAARWFRHRCVQHHHHKSARVRSFPNGNFTSRVIPKGKNRAGVWWEFYYDRPSKLTGRRHTLHIEIKHSGHKEVVRAGIETPIDLLSFDIRAHFEKHLRFYDINKPRLGKHYDNTRHNSRRQKPAIETRTIGSKTQQIDLDTLHGERCYRRFSQHEIHEGEHISQFDHSLQRFLQVYGHGPFAQLLRGPIT